MKKSLLLCALLGMAFSSLHLSLPAAAQEDFEIEDNTDLDFEDDGSGDEFGSEDFNPPPPPPPASTETQSTAEEVKELSLDPGGESDLSLPTSEVTETQQQEEQEDQKKIDEINSKLKARKKSAKKTRSKKKSGAMKRLQSDCQMRAKPSRKAKSLTIVKKGAKIWTESHNSSWVKVYRKKGHAFMSKSCF